MSLDQLRENLWQLSCVAGMNQRYYEYEMRTLWWYDFVFRFVALVFGAFTLYATVKAAKQSKKTESNTHESASPTLFEQLGSCELPKAPTAPAKSGWPLWNTIKEFWRDKVIPNSTPICAALAMLGTGLSNIIPVTAWERQAITLREKWTEIRAGADVAFYSLDNMREQKIAPSWLVDRFLSLHERRISIMSTEPATKDALLDRCYEMELKSRGQASEPRPQDVAAGRVSRQ